MRNVTDTERDSSTATRSAFAARLREYARLMRLDRPIGIWLLLWPVLWALWISADGHPDERLFVIFVIGTFVMRSAGCVMNDFADREFDPHWGSSRCSRSSPSHSSSRSTGRRRCSR